MKNYSFFLLLCAAITSTGCASILGSPLHSVRIDSTPRNAIFTVVDEQGEQVAEGVTPDTVVLHTSGALFEAARYFVNFEHKDYPGKTTILEGKISPFYFLNLLYVFPGLLIDPFTGAMYKLPNESHAVLTNQPIPAAADGSKMPNKQPTLAPEAAQ